MIEANSIFGAPDGGAYKVGDTIRVENVPAGWRGRVQVLSETEDKETAVGIVDPTNSATDGAPGAGESGTETPSKDMTMAPNPGATAANPEGDVQTAGATETLDSGRASQIDSVIAGLDKKSFTADGSPSVDAINAAMPEGSEKVTAAERDEAWARVQKGA